MLPGSGIITRSNCNNKLSVEVISGIQKDSSSL